MLQLELRSLNYYPLTVKDTKNFLILNIFDNEREEIGKNAF